MPRLPHRADVYCLQMILGFVRPKPGGNIRPFWNAVHHNLGRLTIISAWATLYIGIYMAHESLTYQSSYLYWLTPCVAVMGALVLLDVVLTLYDGLRSDAATMDKMVALEMQQDPSGTVGNQLHDFPQQDGRYFQSHGSRVYPGVPVSGGSRVSPGVPVSHWGPVTPLRPLR